MCRMVFFFTFIVLCLKGLSSKKTLLSTWPCKICLRHWQLRSSRLASWINHLILNWAVSNILSFSLAIFSWIENMTIIDEFPLLRPLAKNEECFLSSFPTSLGKIPRIYSYVKRISKLFLETFLAEYYQWFNSKT